MTASSDSTAVPGRPGSNHRHLQGSKRVAPEGMPNAIASRSLVLERRGGETLPTVMGTPPLPRRSMPEAELAAAATRLRNCPGSGARPVDGMRRVFFCLRVRSRTRSVRYRHLARPAHDERRPRKSVETRCCSRGHCRTSRVQRGLRRIGCVWRALGPDSAEFGPTSGEIGGHPPGLCRIRPKLGLEAIAPTQHALKSKIPRPLSWSLRAWLRGLSRRMGMRGGHRLRFWFREFRRRRQPRHLAQQRRSARERSRLLRQRTHLGVELLPVRRIRPRSAPAPRSAFGFLVRFLRTVLWLRPEPGDLERAQAFGNTRLAFQ